MGYSTTPGRYARYCPKHRCVLLEDPTAELYCPVHVHPIVVWYVLDLLTGRFLYWAHKHSGRMVVVDACEARARAQEDSSKEGAHRKASGRIRLRDPSKSNGVEAETGAEIVVRSG